MDKYEYKVRSEEISRLIDKEKYIEAAEIADIIDWRRVKSVTMLLKIAALYRVNRRNEDSRAILMLAYERYPANRSVVHSLCEVSIELDDVVAAIEYYKQFVKLSPNDSGVYTLRYRILEAQEASLEERIAILDELKTKDYQEEWAYELAYLYHRVGLGTKCVEECDDIILWFGDGPYVMKAMELKMLHVPLTEIQQKKYEIMHNNSSANYSEELYVQNDEQNEYDEHQTQNTYYPEEEYSQDMDYYNQQAYNQEQYDQMMYANTEIDNNSNDDFFVEQNYSDNGYGQEDYNYGNSYEEELYNSEVYSSEEYNTSEYDGNYYENGDFQESYEQTDGTYNYYNDEYDADGEYYSQNASYTNNEYASSAAVDMSQYNTINLQKVVAEGMEELWADEKLNDNQTNMDEETQNYDTKVVSGLFSKDDLKLAQSRDFTDNTVYFEHINDSVLNSPVSADKAGEADNIEEPDNNEVVNNEVTDNKTIDVETSGDEDDTTTNDNKDVNEALDNDMQLQSEESVQNLDKPLTNENLLKDNNDFQGINEASDYEEELTREFISHTAQMAKMVDTDSRYTRKIAELTEGTTEEAPEPHTGAIKKVIIPGENARVIKEETDMDVLRDVTEKSVNQEHIRMENNCENVYQNEGNINVTDEGELQSVNAQVGLENVLAKWERMKQENFQKHQEDVKQNVLNHTGRIFEDFNNSVKTGILGELEEEISQVNSVQEDKSFLAADITTDIPQQNNDSTDEVRHDINEGYEQSLEYTEEDLQNSQEYIEEGYEDLQEYTKEDYEEVQGYVEAGYEESQEYTKEDYKELQEYTEEGYEESQEYSEKDYEQPYEYTEDNYYEDSQEYYSDEYYDDQEYINGEYSDGGYYEDDVMYSEYDEIQSQEQKAVSEFTQRMNQRENEIDPEDAEMIAEMAKEDALKTQEIKMNTADLSSLSERIMATTHKEAKGAKREEIREFSSQEQKLFENFAVTKKIKKQVISALEDMTLCAYTGNVIITGEAGLDTVRMAKNLVCAYQDRDESFSGRVAKITGEKLNNKNLVEVFNKLVDGALIIEKANGMTAQKLYEMAVLLNQESIGIIVIIEDTKKEINKLFAKQAMIADYFNIRIDLIEMDINALVAYAKNYALALEYSIDDLGVLALYTRISNIQSGNHVVTKDEVREIIDEAIDRSRKSKLKNFVDVLFARRYDSEDMIVLKERDFI